MTCGPVRGIDGARVWPVMVIALVMSLCACNSSGGGNNGFDFDGVAVSSAPVEQIPEIPPTVEEIVAATTAAVSFTYEVSLETVVTDENFELRGVFSPATGEGYNEWELAPSVGRMSSAQVWIDADNLLRSDGRLDGRLRPTAGHIYEFLGLGVEPPADRGLPAALTALLAADADYAVIGTAPVDGTELLQLQGARFGKIGRQTAAPLSVDVWIDANNRLVRVVTTATFDSATIPSTARSISFHYLSESPELPTRPAFVGTGSPEPRAEGAMPPLVEEIVAATGSMPYFEIGGLLVIGGGIELRQRSVYDATTRRGFTESEAKQPGEDFEWLDLSWYEDGESWVTEDGQRDRTRPASGDISDVFTLFNVSGPTLDDVLISALETTSGLVLVGEEDLNGASVLHLIGGSGEGRDETVVEVWVDHENRLVRYVATSWQLNIDPAAGISTTDVAYPDQAPELPVRPDADG